MKKVTNKSIKTKVAKATEKSFITIADIFSGMICHGRSYEPKMPEKLKK